jgi:hypothetical protein
VKNVALLLLFASTAAAQFDLQLLDKTGPRTPPPVFDLGAAGANEPLSAQFRLRNSSAATAMLSTLSVAGVGFTLDGPALPVAVDPQASVEFTVTFRAPDVGSYSATLRAGDVAIVLTASVQPRLTYRVENSLLSGMVDFGSVQRGSSARRRFTVTNETGVVLTVPGVTLQGPDFAMVGIPPSGSVLQPTQSAGFAVDFTPSITGARQAMLTIGTSTYPLTGQGVDPPLPRPIAAIDLKSASSAQQGTLVITFDQPAATSGTGTATLDFRGGAGADPTIAFAAGGRIASFPVSPGDTRVALPFQTGTTAGTIAFTVQLGGMSSQASVDIPGRAVSMISVQGVRSAGSIEVRVTGFDNTRSMGQLAYTFYDAAGNVIAPGAIPADASGDFARFFAASDGGGAFLLRATFPVTGDAAQVASFEVTAANGVGSTKSSRTPF